MLKSLLYILLVVFTYSCSSSAYVQKPQNLKGKKIGISSLTLSAIKNDAKKLSNDTICFCIGKAATDALLPYLQQAGFTIVTLVDNRKLDIGQAYAAADSLHLDYILTGMGVVQFQGKSTFMHDLNIQIFDAQTRELAVSGSFSGSAVGAAKAAGKIGKKILRQIK